ncbi:MAG: 50S ribosomal protein L24 [Clostridia bacterium]|nr:50S ribosomal protein L24 [Clostridia bacterium]MBP5593000.1 50S ribosomal protein L24 [Clostridia bacterium]MBP5649121.1 50S ribosomal protein L24 [Clostridia bacterium]
MNKLNVKSGDKVIVLTGKDKGKTGKILSVNPEKGNVKVEGVNIVTKHVKPRNANQPGGIMKEPGNIDVSNVMIVCPACGKQTRVAHKIDENGNKSRVCKKCGASLDATKSTDKKAKKSDSAVEEKPKKTAKKAAKA